MKTVFVVALCAMAARVFADVSLLDQERFVRASEDADSVVWETNEDGSRNVTLIQNGPREVSIEASIDLSAYAGRDIEFVIVADGENVVRGEVDGAPRPFAPLMTHFEVRCGEWATYRRHEVAGAFPEGTFRDREIVVPFLMPTYGFAFGLHLFSNCESGKILVKKFSIREAGPYLDRYFRIPDGFRCEYSKEVLRAFEDPHRLRGIVAGQDFGEADYVKMRGWGANLIRFWCDPNRLEKTDALLPIVAELGFKVILAPICPGGKGNRNGYALFNDERLHDEYLAGLKKLAGHYKGDSRIFAIGLMNEPFQELRKGAEDQYFFLNVQYEAAQAIREADPTRVLVASASGGGSPEDYRLDAMRPLPMKDVLYEMHFYYPMFCTHLGLYGNRPGPDVKYPGGRKRGTTWTRETLRECMARMDDFEKTYGAKIFVGEFSCMNWCPGAAQWLDDVCGLLEERGYIWTYHDYGEYPGWNLEYRSDCPCNAPVKLKPGETGDRLEVLKKHWAKNAVE